MKSEKAFDVLIVEDSEPDKELLSFLFANCPVPTRLHFATDGVIATDFVFKRGDFKDVPAPDLIILDLNLPAKSGRAVLREIRGEQRLCHIPIVMMTTSTSSTDINEGYCAGANAFISKSVDLEAFQERINLIASFWFKCAILPSRP